MEVGGLMVFFSLQISDAIKDGSSSGLCDL
jgi:hypothetical protein